MAPGTTAYRTVTYRNRNKGIVHIICADWQARIPVDLLLPYVRSSLGAPVKDWTPMCIVRGTIESDPNAPNK